MFKPDPKPTKVEKTQSKGIDRAKMKHKYKCKICGDKYSKRVGDLNRKWCDNHECMIAIAMQRLKKQKEAESKKARKDHRAEKRAFFKKPQHQEPLQKAINTIVRLLDIDEPCIVFPHDSLNGIAKQAGHMYGVGSNPNLRYFVGQIFGESVHSNTNHNIGTPTKLKGVEIRHGKEHVAVIEWVKLNNKELHLTKNVKTEKLGIANQIIREVKKGKIYTRREIDERIGIYKLPDSYEI